MLNISNNSLRGRIDRTQLVCLAALEKRTSGNTLKKVLIALSVVVLGIMFLPWTQNIRSNGYITTLKPNQRPQTVNSIIAGRIEKWYVQEGDQVVKGDTLLHISEIKDSYFDPDLLARTKDQLKSKELSVRAYMEKVQSLDTQIDALNDKSQLKLEQARNKLKQARLKVKSDSIAYEAAKTNFEISGRQLERFEELHQQGLKSLTDLENRRLTQQKSQSDLIEAENKLLASRNEIINALLEISSVRNQYRDEISKAESEKFQAMSNMYDAEAVVTKLQNEFMNYSVRTGMYYIRAPQDGFITKTMISGIGETLKEGDPILSIMPTDYQLTVEMYVRPIDLPLIRKGQDVRIQFDGWPAIVFSGWPGSSIGTYAGEVFAIDNFISENGKYRVLVQPKEGEYPWPKALRVGSGTKNILLLENVPVWYEVWRQINGFPPDFYDRQESKNNGDSSSSQK